MNGENVDWIWITDNGPFEIPESQFAFHRIGLDL